MNPHRLAAIKVPLAEGISLLLSSNSESMPEDGLNSQPFLPPGWKAKLGTGCSPLLYAPAAAKEGMHPLWLIEVASFHWELQTEGDQLAAGLSVKSSLSESAAKKQEHQRSSGGRLNGGFRFTTYLGAAWLQVFHKSQPLGQPLRFEVITEKIDYSKEYRAMVEAIAKRCSQLLLDWGAPTTVNISSDPTKPSQTLLEKFLFLRHVLGPERLDLYLETLSRRPHSSLLREQVWRPTAMASPELFARDPLRFGRRWEETGAGPSSGFQPQEVLTERKYDSLNTPPNRFVKFALQTFRGICEDVINARIHNPATGQVQVLNRERGAAWHEAVQMRDTLDACLASTFFAQAGPLRRIPFESQVLQKREGYREILHTWLMLDVAAQIDWPGRNDAYDGTNRDVATLYEFWLYFVLVDLFQKRLGMTWLRESAVPDSGPIPFCCKREDGSLRINLKRGGESFCRFRWRGGGQDLLIHFFYNRRFREQPNPLEDGSYSTGFRPDYTIVVLPAQFENRGWRKAEELAEAEGRIAYLHLDAKYRIDQLKELFGKVEETDEDRLESKSTGTVKNADLYKMHTYNEAIRRTVGSYVLYPGTDTRVAYQDDGPDRNVYRRYHEIVPGMGAFAIKPKVSDGNGELLAHGIECLQVFLSDFLAHQASWFTQSYRIGYWTHETISELPHRAKEVSLGLNGTAGPHATKPARDTQVLLGFVRDEAGAEACRSASVFFCHAVEWKSGAPRAPDGSSQPGQPTDLGFDPFRCDLFVAYSRHTTVPWMAQVANVKLVTATERATELHLPLADMKAAYYYRFQLQYIEAAPQRDVSSLVQHRPGKPIAKPLTDLARCSLLASPAT